MIGAVRNDRDANGTLRQASMRGARRLVSFTSGLLAGLALASPDEPGPEADEQAGEQAQRNQGPGLDDTQSGRADAERGRLRVGVRLDVGLEPFERGDGVPLLGFKLPTALSPPGALGGAGGGHGIEPPLGEDNFGGGAFCPSVNPGVQVRHREPAGREEHHDERHSHEQPSPQGRPPVTFLHLTAVGSRQAITSAATLRCE
jgi:hypothetical protein